MYCLNRNVDSCLPVLRKAVDTGYVGYPSLPTDPMFALSNAPKRVAMRSAAYLLLTRLQRLLEGNQVQRSSLFSSKTCKWISTPERSKWS